MTLPGLQGARMRALRGFEAGSSGFLKPPPSLHAPEKPSAAPAAPRASLSFVEGRIEDMQQQPPQQRSRTTCRPRTLFNTPVVTHDSGLGRVNVQWLQSMLRRMRCRRPGPCAPSTLTWTPSRLPSRKPRLSTGGRATRSHLRRAHRKASAHFAFDSLCDVHVGLPPLRVTCFFSGRRQRRSPRPAQHDSIYSLASMDPGECLSLIHI